MSTVSTGYGNKPACAANNLLNALNNPIICKQAVKCSAGPSGCGRCQRHCNCAQVNVIAGNQGLNIVDPIREFEASSDEEAAAAANPTMRRTRHRAGHVQMSYKESSDDEGSESESKPFTPLMHPGATLGDVTAAFGATNNMTDKNKSRAERTVNASGDGNIPAVREMRKTLDKAVDAVVKIMVGDDGAREVFIKKWHESRAEAVSDASCLMCCEQLLKVLPHMSPEYHIIASVVATCASKSQTCQKYVTSQTEKRKLFKAVVQTDGVVPKRPKKTVARVSTKIVEDAVDFIIRSDNIQMLSWGVKIVLLDGEKIEIPALSRKVSKSTMWKKYERAFPDKQQRVQKESFRIIVRTLTARQDKSIAAVDYKVSELVHGNHDRMKRLIKGEVTDAAKQRALLEEAEAVFSFVKSSYGQHVDGVSCSCHNPGHALGVDGEEVADGDIQCEECAAIFAWFEKLALAVPMEFRQLVFEAAQKVQLSMAHAMRTVVQQKRIAEIEEELRKDPTHAKVIIDFKMKLQPLYWRESTLAHYGKRYRNIWLGAVLSSSIHSDTRVSVPVQYM